MMAIVDAKTGQIHNPPAIHYKAELLLPLGMSGNVEFRQDSTLMIVRRSCVSSPDHCGTYFFNWTGSAFQLVARTRSQPFPE